MRRNGGGGKQEKEEEEEEGAEAEAKEAAAARAGQPSPCLGIVRRLGSPLTLANLLVLPS